MANSDEYAPTERLRQAVAVVGLVILAFASLLSGTDRQSREFPSSPSMVGWTYDTGAARARAIAAFNLSGPKSAIPMARRAILSDPVSAETISILGRSQLYAKQPLEARRTFEVAGQLGWRDAMTQIYWLDQALQSENYQVAAERLDALLRQSPNDENRDSFLAIVSETPEGRGMLAKQLTKVPTWASNYVTDLKDVPSEQLLQRVDVVQRAGHGIWDCAQTAIFVQNLINAKLLDQAQRVWQLNCSSSNTLVYDGGFDRSYAARTTIGFEWQLSDRGDISIAEVKDQKGNPRLDLSSKADVSVPIIRQLLVLTPGRYRLSWRTPETGPTAARKLSAALACDLDLRRALPGSPIPGRPNTYVQEFDIDATCRNLLLAFWLAPNAEVNIDDVMLQRASR